jgi:hypothetical protein
MKIGKAAYYLLAAQFQLKPVASSDFFHVLGAQERNVITERLSMVRVLNLDKSNATSGGLNLDWSTQVGQLKNCLSVKTRKHAS